MGLFQTLKGDILRGDDRATTRSPEGAVQREQRREQPRPQVLVSVGLFGLDLHDPRGPSGEPQQGLYLNHNPSRPISRTQARALRLKAYLAPICCSRDGTQLRNTKTGKCCACTAREKMQTAAREQAIADKARESALKGARAAVLRELKTEERQREREAARKAREAERDEKRRAARAAKAKALCALSSDKRTP